VRTSIAPDLRASGSFRVLSRAEVWAPRRRQRRAAALRRARGAFVVLVLAMMALTLAAVVAPRAFGYTPLIVRSDSMGGAYPVGSLAVARPVRSAKVDRGDVVLIERAGRAPVLHRVVEKHETRGRRTVRTKGDASRSRDPGRYVLPEQVPVAMFHVPHLGYLVAFISAPVGWAVLIVLPAALLCAATLVQIWASGCRQSAVAWISWRTDAYA
jgi:signal peptidase I